MKRSKRLFALSFTLVLLFTWLVMPFGTSATEEEASEDKVIRPMEYLGRGLIAAKVDDGVFLSWRFLGDEPDDVVFNVYRDNVKIAEISGKSNYIDPDGTADSVYEVSAVIDGVEYAREGSIEPVLTTTTPGALPGAYFDIPLTRPDPLGVPCVQAYQYSVSGYQYEPVDVNLFREIRVAYTDGLTVSQAQFDSWVAKFREYFNEPEWAPVNEFTPESTLSKELFEELEQAFIRYCDELDRGPKLDYQRNEDGSLVQNVATYSVMDLSFGDLDGDGEYEYIVKWEPSNARDSMFSDPIYAGGYNHGATTASSPTIIDAVKKDGTVLWRINVGYNMRAGEHDTQLLVEDFDGDGKSELIIKTADGTTTGTLDENGNYVIKEVVGDPNATYLKFQEYMENGDVESLEKYWSVMNQYSIGYRNPGGTNPSGDADPNQPTWVKIYGFGPMGSGNEYVTAFDGETGAIIDTIDFPFPYGEKAWGILPVQERGGYRTLIENVGNTQANLDPNEAYWLQNPWGHYPWGDHQGNRANRYLGGVAYLEDGSYSAIIGRGYYHRTTISAFTIRDGKLVVQGTFDSAAEEDPYKWQNRGNHSFAVGDIDGDGYDEICYKATFKLIDGAIRPIALAGAKFPGRGTPEPEINQNLISEEIQNADTSTWQPLRHGDRHDMLPVDASNKILFWSCNEEWLSNDIRDGLSYGWIPAWSLHDPLTGEIKIAPYGARDYDGGSAGNYDPRFDGVEIFARYGTYSASTFERLPYTIETNSVPFFWDGDLNHELISGTQVQKFNPDTERIDTVFAPTDVWCSVQKNMPILQADLFGDWREEFVVGTGEGFWWFGTVYKTLRVFTTVTPTEYGIRTLVHDPMYRTGAAKQNCTYNQGPHPSFYLDANAPLPEKRDDIEILVLGAITEVLEYSPITALYGTEWDALNLPGKVQVKTETGAIATLDVEWNSEDYDPTAGADQVITGTIAATDKITNPEGLKAQITVKVAYDFSDVVLSAPESIERTKTAQAVAKGILTNGAEVDMLAAGFDVEFFSSNPDVASVDENGLVTANKVGSAEISAVVIVDGEAYQIDSVTINVVEMAIEGLSIELSGSPDIVEIGEELEFTVTANGAVDLAGMDVRFTYDPELFELKEVVFNDGFGYSEYEVQGGLVKLLAVVTGQDAGLTGDVVIAKLVLTAKDIDAASSAAILGGSQLSDIQGALFTQAEDISYTVAVANSDITGGGTAINDLVMIAKAFGKTAGEEGYDPALDMNKDGVIDIIDIAYVASRILNK